MILLVGDKRTETWKLDQIVCVHVSVYFVGMHICIYILRQLI